jgi:predicted PurR-regulated permease PerM
MAVELPTKLSSVVGARRARMKGVEQLVPWVIAAIAIAFLYFGRTALVPLTLAVLLSFLLAPIVAGLRKLRFGRQLSVIFAVVLALGTIIITSAVIVSQAGRLAKDAPAYAETIAAKAAVLRNEFHQRLGLLLTETGRTSTGPTAAEFAQKAGEKRRVSALTTRAIPVEVREPPVTAMQEIEAIVLPALGPIETGLIVLVVAIFILFQKEDLRDRLIRLMGTADIHRTTVALDDGAKRLSRYFLSQFVVNCGFGAVIWAGLFLIGIPSPGLWGILAGLLRFVPYVGVFVAMLGPIALAAAVDPGWSMVIYVALLFVIVEPIVGYVIEPLLYGHSTGLSPVSVVVAALFWTLLWGPVGLVLAMPLTLMLVVLGRHIPAFYVFDILLGDRPALSSAETFYQRALAGHPEQALEQAETMLETQSLLGYYDEVILGALRLVAADVDRGAIDRSALHGVREVAMEVISTLDDFPGSREAGIGSDTTASHFVCISGRGPLDPIIAAMIAQLARRGGFTVTEHSRDAWGGGSSSQFDPGTATMACLVGLFGDSSQRRIALIVASLRQRFPNLQTVVGVSRTIESGSEDIHTTLAGLCSAMGLAEALQMSA